MPHVEGSEPPALVLPDSCNAQTLDALSSARPRRDRQLDARRCWMPRSAPLHPPPFDARAAAYLTEQDGEEGGADDEPAGRHDQRRKPCRDDGRKPTHRGPVGEREVRDEGQNGNDRDRGAEGSSTQLRARCDAPSAASYLISRLVSRPSCSTSS